MALGICEPVSWALLAPLWKSAIPGLSMIAYPAIGYVSILAVFFALSKLNKMPLFGVFASFAGDILLKIWLSVGIVLLIVSVFCSV